MVTTIPSAEDAEIADINSQLLETDLCPAVRNLLIRYRARLSRPQNELPWVCPRCGDDILSRPQSDVGQPWLRTYDTEKPPKMTCPCKGACDDSCR